MLQRYCFNGRLARISYVVMSVFVLFCVDKDLIWRSKKQKKTLKTFKVIVRLSLTKIKFLGKFCY